MLCYPKLWHAISIFWRRLMALQGKQLQWRDAFERLEQAHALAAVPRPILLLNYMCHLGLPQVWALLLTATVAAPRSITSLPAAR